VAIIHVVFPLHKPVTVEKLERKNMRLLKGVIAARVGTMITVTFS
jgi:hypothetical protein